MDLHTTGKILLATSTFLQVSVQVRLVQFKYQDQLQQHCQLRGETVMSSFTFVM